jgi:hypothetical protein
MGLAYSSVCEKCEELKTFTFVREGDRKKDWYENTLLQVKKKQEQDRLKISQRRKAGHTIKKIS